MQFLICCYMLLYVVICAFSVILIVKCVVELECVEDLTVIHVAAVCNASCVTVHYFFFVII